MLAELRTEREQIEEAIVVPRAAGPRPGQKARSSTSLDDSDEKAG
jgi:hypothetical protein